MGARRESILFITTREYSCVKDGRVCGFGGINMEIVKVKDYDNENGMLPAEADKELAKRNLRPLTEAEWIGLPTEEMQKLRAYTPVYLGRRKDGLLSRGDGGFGYGRVVGAGDRLYWRCGVVGVPIEAKGKHKHEWKCDCGAKRKV